MLVHRIPGSELISGSPCNPGGSSGDGRGARRQLDEGRRRGGRSRNARTAPARRDQSIRDPPPLNLKKETIQWINSLRIVNHAGGASHRCRRWRIDRGGDRHRVTCDPGSLRSDLMLALARSFGSVGNRPHANHGADGREAWSGTNRVWTGRFTGQRPQDSRGHRPRRTGWLTAWLTRGGVKRQFSRAGWLQRF